MPLNRYKSSISLNPRETAFLGVLADAISRIKDPQKLDQLLSDFERSDHTEVYGFVSAADIAPQSTLQKIRKQLPYIDDDGAWGILGATLEAAAELDNDPGGGESSQDTELADDKLQREIERRVTAGESKDTYDGHQKSSKYRRDHQNSLKYFKQRMFKRRSMRLSDDEVGNK
jgi:hypothetical protein